MHTYCVHNLYLSNNYHTDIERRYEKTEWLIGIVMHYDSIRVEVHVQEYVYKYGIETGFHSEIKIFLQICRNIQMAF